MIIHIRNKYILLFILLQLSGFIIAEAVPFNSKLMPNVKEGLRFVENKGQVLDQFGEQRSDVLFIGTAGNLKVVLTNNAISYQFEQSLQSRDTLQCVPTVGKMQSANFLERERIEKELKPADVKVNRVDVEFLGANQHVTIIKTGKSHDYINYIRAGENQPLSYSCFFYDTIIYKNVYDNIDIVFYSSNQPNISNKMSNILINLHADNLVFKYDIIVNKGGDISDIKLKYNGCSDISVIEGKLCIKQGDINFSEYIPVSFITENSEQPSFDKLRMTSDRKLLKVDYVLNGDVLSFKSDEWLSVESTDKKVSSTDKTGKIKDGTSTQSLTIDPYFIYATYYGSSGEDVGMEVAIDYSGNYFLGGYTTSTTNIATSGAYQTVMKGEKDAFLVKFSEDGTRQWATYFGGTDFDYGHTLACDIGGNVYLAGWTQTRSGLATAGSFQFNYGGGEFDSFLAKFSGSGSLVWSTYFGGQYEDYINDIVVDGSGDLAFIGRTSSPSNIASPLGFQVVFGGNFDGFLVKFNNEGKRIWGTFYGGEGFDVGMELCTDIFNNIAITGFTQSKTGMTSLGAFKNSLSGIWDAFIAKFDRNGNRYWGTYFGGADDDNGWGIGADGSGNLFVTGNTNSFESISTPGVHKEVLGESELDAFVVKFDNAGSRVWGSYFGGDDEEFGNAGVVDAWENFIFSGNTLSDLGISTSDAPQTTRSSQRDAFVAKFNSAGQQLFGSYYGAEGNEYGHGVTVDSYGRIYMTGYSFSSNLFTSSDAHQSSFGGAFDAFIVKIGDVLPTDSIFTEEFTDTLCADNMIQIPFDVTGTFVDGNVFTAQLSNMNGKFTEFYNLGTLTSTQSGTITGWIPRETLTGSKYRIRVIGSNPPVIGSDNGLDISIYELPDAEITGNIIVCTGDRAIYKANKIVNMSYKWIVTDGNIEGADDTEILNVHWDTEGIGFIKLIVTNSVTSCVDSSEIVIAVKPKVTASSIFGPLTLCPNNETLYYTTSNTGILSSWFIQGGELLGNIDSDTVYVSWFEQKTGKLFLIQIDDDSGCRDTNSISVNLYDIPKPIIIGDTVVKAQSKTIYKTTPVSKYTYFWTVEGGQIDGTAYSSTLYVDWKKQGWGTVCLHQKDKDTGCEDSLKFNISIRESAGEVITGKTVVCSNSIENYSVNDTNYNYIWMICGGKLNSDSTLKIVDVEWDSAGNGAVLLCREDRKNFIKDTLILGIEISLSPEFLISGTIQVCDGVYKIYNSVISDSQGNEQIDNFIYKWSITDGTLVGNDVADSVIVYWDRIDADTSISILTGQVQLTITNTENNCTESQLLAVEIYRTPDIRFTGDSLVCENEIKEYTTNLQPGLEYNWQIGGGIIIDNSGDTSIIVKWGSQQLGFVRIFATNTNGCTDSIMMDIRISKSPEKPVITQSGKTLFSSAEEGNQWYLSNTLIEGAVSKNFSPESSGIYTVQVSSANGCHSEMSAPYNFDINDTYVSEFNQNSIVLFPNPTHDLLNIEINLLYYEIPEIKVFDLLGNCKFTGQWTVDSGQWTVGSSQLTVDMSALSSGVYLLVVKFKSEEFKNFRIIKF